KILNSMKTLKIDLRRVPYNKENPLDEDNNVAKGIFLYGTKMKEFLDGYRKKLANYPDIVIDTGKQKNQQVKITEYFDSVAISMIKNIDEIIELLKKMSSLQTTSCF